MDKNEGSFSLVRLLPFVLIFMHTYIPSKSVSHGEIFFWGFFACTFSLSHSSTRVVRMDFFLRWGGGWWSSESARTTMMMLLSLHLSKHSLLLLHQKREENIYIPDSLVSKECLLNFSLAHPFPRLISNEKKMVQNGAGVKPHHSYKTSWQWLLCKNIYTRNIKTRG